ncbi:MAG: TIGR02757 family protein [Deltaproteobacteria bacterium]|nr:TIGR02757 family protein [Deltaproteobacteria bacterium]
MDTIQFIDQNYHRYHQKGYIFSDPVFFVHQFSHPFDQEAIALLASLLAYGNIKQILRSIENALSCIKKLTPQPHIFVKRLADPVFFNAAKDEFSGFKHRFNTGEDLVLFFKLLSLSWQKYGTLGSHFTQYLDQNDNHIEHALSQLMSDFKKWAIPFRPQSSFYFFLTSPVDGSCCKRWCMFLRWMGRKDDVDLGLWTKHGALAHTFQKNKYLKASQLICPIDTHIGQISKKLKLTQRKNLNWKAAVEITGYFKKLKPEDPVSFDFSLSRAGILKTLGVKHDT